MTDRVPGARRRAAPRGLVAMVHLPPLPGAPRYQPGPVGSPGTAASPGRAGPSAMDRVIQRARSDASVLSVAGVDAILVENFGDAPFYPDDVPPATIAAMTAAVAAIREVTDLPIGINVLRNDAAAALAIAAATGAAFIRVNVHTGGMHTDQGWVRGRAHETLRLREALAPDVAILADIMVKHATPPAGLTLEAAARDAWERGLADALIVSGDATGQATDLEQVDRVRAAVTDAPVIVGSGITAESIGEALDRARAVIVGSALQDGGVAGRPADPDRVRAVVEAKRGA